MNIMAQSISECVSVCMCVCVVCACTCVCPYVYVHTHVRMYVCICICRLMYYCYYVCYSCWIKPGIGAIATFIAPIVAIMLVELNFNLATKLKCCHLYR